MSKSATTLRPAIKAVMPGFAVRDMNRAVDFYTSKLGFRVVFKKGAVFAIVARDGIEISLGLDQSGARIGQGACYLKMEGVDAFYQDLISQAWP